MFTFVRDFLRRGYSALFSYISWQVPVSHFRRIADIALITILLLLAIGLIV